LQDVAENPRNLKITLLDAAQLPRVIDDPKVAAAVINTNFALEGGLDPLKDPLFLEAKDSPYANILVVKDTRTSDPALKKLAGVLNSPQVKQFIEEQYKGAVIPAF
jgi:D-methionine transport system substrate-binding protein